MIMSLINDNPIFMGLENEYAIIGHGKQEDRQRFAADLLDEFKVRFKCIPNVSKGGFFSAIGKFYIDGSHPEYCSPEVSDPVSLIYYNHLFEEFSKAVSFERYKSKIYLSKQNGCYLSGTTFGQHENYATDSDLACLPMLIYPFLATRVIFTGTGGFCIKPDLTSIEFTICPRSHFTTDGFNSSSRCLFYYKTDMYNNNRVHLYSGINMTDNVMFLKFATMSLVLRVAQMKPDMFKNVPQLEQPAKKMQQISLGFPFDNNMMIEQSNGRSISVLDIQRYYLDICERCADEDFLPPWSTQVLLMWKDLLDRLAVSVDMVDDCLCWGIKYKYFNEMLKDEGLSINELNRKVIDDSLKYRLIKADYDFSIISNEGSLYSRLANSGNITEMIQGIPKIDFNNIWLPARGRAKERATLINRLSGQDFTCSWSAITNKKEGKTFTLPTPSSDKIIETTNENRKLINKYLSMYDK